MNVRKAVFLQRLSIALIGAFLLFGTPAFAQIAPSPSVQGTLTAGDCIKAANAFQVKDAGAACGTGSSASPTFTGTVTMPTETNTVGALVLPAGTVLTSPLAGNIENNGTNLFYTATSGPTRHTLAFTDVAQTFLGIVTLPSPALTGTVTGANTVPLGVIQQGATNTVLGNYTSGTANYTAQNVGSCSTTASAIIYTTNTGWGCNTTINAGTLGGATFASPGAIGGTTAAAVNTTGLISKGTKFTTTGCSVSSTTGGSAAGTFTLGANTCTVIITINGATGLAAPNGWNCNAEDQTALLVVISQAASSTTTCSLNIPATAGTTDVVRFTAQGY